jgi:hypothetical protein
MGPAMNQFREAAIEREVEAPRVKPVVETRVVPPVSHLSDMRPRREESRIEKPIATRQTPEPDLLKAADHILEQKAPDIPIGRSQPDTRRGPAVPKAARVQAEFREQTPREVIREVAHAQRETVKTGIHSESVKTESAQRYEPPQFPAPKPARPEIHPAVTKPAPQVRKPESPVPSPVGPFAEFDRPRAETAAPSVHVTIGKVTVQATLPAANVAAPARTAAAAGPRLTLETYLNRRGGRP